jgi:hypothetical protein
MFNSLVSKVDLADDVDKVENLAENKDEEKLAASSAAHAENITRHFLYTVCFLCKMAVIAGESAKNIKTGSLKKCKIFKVQHAV